MTLLVLNFMLARARDTAGLGYAPSSSQYTGELSAARVAPRLRPPPRRARARTPPAPRRLEHPHRAHAPF